MTDDDLLGRIRAGDTAALEELLAKHAGAIQRFGAKMCRDPEDAKDVVQDTLLAAARTARDFRGASSVATWLYAIARSYCIKKRRVSKHAPRETVPLDEAIAGDAPPPDQAVADREIGAVLEEAIGALDPESREVLVLRDIEGLTAAEVAEVLGTSTAAVKSRLHRARAQVRARLAPYADEAPRPGCPDIVAVLSQNLEGDISADECAAMEKHVSGCARCGAACDSLKRALALCKAQRAGDVPREVQEMVRSAVRSAV